VVAPDKSPLSKCGVAYNKGNAEKKPVRHVRYF